MWVLIEHREGEIEEASLEVLSEARRLANRAKLTVSSLVLGHSATPFAEPLSRYGADNVYLVEHEFLKTYSTDGYAEALTELLIRLRPEFFLLSGTALGKDLAPRLASRFGTGLVSDCRVLDINGEGLMEMTRSSCGGRVYTTMACSSMRPQIATVCPGVLGLGKQNRTRLAAFSMG